MRTESEISSLIKHQVNAHSADQHPPSSQILRIVYPDAKKIRSRQVVTRSRARSTGKYPSWKMKRMIQWESQNELNAFRLLDCDPTVLAFNEQPCEIFYQMGGVIQRHYPDILVKSTDRKTFWEVKPEHNSNKNILVARTTVMSGLRLWGYEYQVVSSQELSRQPRLKNCQTLLHFGARHNPSDSERERLRLLFIRLGEFNWGEACRGTYGPKGRETICRFVLQGLLSLDTNQEWTTRTVIGAGEVRF